MYRPNATAASLLGFLHEGPRSGWELVRAIEGSVGYFWSVTRSQVYRELKVLSAHGLIAEGAVGARERLPYALTEAGRRAFQKWMDRSPEPELMRFPLLVQTFFGALLGAGGLGKYASLHRAEHVKRLAEYRQLQSAVKMDRYQAATLSFGIAYEQTVLTWLDGLPWASGHSPRRRAARPGRP
jgi:DNA-binding PadR family transcriptional regulator